MKYLLAVCLFLAVGFCSGEEKITRLTGIDLEARHPANVDLKLMSTDPDYGYTAKKPIRLGSKKEYGGPAAEREYLTSLLDHKGEKVRFSRLGSGGGDPLGNILDMYHVITSDGTKVMLYISMYHPEKAPSDQPAPVGFYKVKR